MWKCSKCGVENEDYFEACRNCSNIAPAPMKPILSENQSDEPRLGRISVIIGLVALSQYISVWLYAPKTLSGGIMILLSFNVAIALGCVRLAYSERSFPWRTPNLDSYHWSIAERFANIALVVAKLLTKQTPPCGT